MAALAGILLWCAGPAVAAPPVLRDGRVFDPGFRMTGRADSAPSELDLMRFSLGQWDVEYKSMIEDSITFVGEGFARVSYMNRGHGIMERFHCEDFDGDVHELSSILFIAYNPARSMWSAAIASSYSENITAYNGNFDENRLVLMSAVRRGGGIYTTFQRMTYQPGDDNRFDVRLEESTDCGGRWSTTLIKTYRRRAETEDFLVGATDFGEPVRDLPPEARAFDFLVGEWTTQQEITFPTGQTVQFATNATGVHTLNGHAIIEFNWYDVDPNLPDAATSIVRVYNRAMRRWECMYITNRFNSILYFGGCREGERIVLYPFETHTARSPISFFVFHDMRENSYSWHAESSNDHGDTFKKTWVIDATRRR